MYELTVGSEGAQLRMYQVSIDVLFGDMYSHSGSMLLEWRLGNQTTGLNVAQLEDLEDKLDAASLSSSTVLEIDPSAQAGWKVHRALQPFFPCGCHTDMFI